MIGPVFFLSYKRFRYLKLALVAIVLASTAYALDQPLGGRNGGTRVGYALGGIATALMLWLTWFGARKRHYRSTGAPLGGWLSAHVYLGLTLLLIVPLHSAFHFGWNVHTLAYALIVGVIASGIFGVILYASVPTLMTTNRPGEKMDALLQRIADIDGEARRLAVGLPDVLSSAVVRAIESTRIGGSFRRRLAGRDPGCGTEYAFRTMTEYTAPLDDRQRANLEQLVAALSSKRTLLHRIRTDVRYETMLRMWLPVHVPLTFAALAAVATHIFVVFYYY